MIARIMRLIRSPCEDAHDAAATERLHATRAEANSAISEVVAKSLDRINDGLDPAVKPYTADQLDRAMVAALARVKRGLRMRRKVAEAKAEDDLLDEALAFLDTPKPT